MLVVLPWCASHATPTAESINISKRSQEKRNKRQKGPFSPTLMPYRLLNMSLASPNTISRLHNPIHALTKTLHPIIIIPIPQLWSTLVTGAVSLAAVVFWARIATAWCRCRRPGKNYNRSSWTTNEWTASKGILYSSRRKVTRWLHLRASVRTRASSLASMPQKKTWATSTFQSIMKQR